MVVRVVDGRTHRLTLNGRRLGEASTWIELQRSRWEHVLDVVDEYLEERRETQ